MGNLGIPELVVIFVLALVLFGPRKLPELGRTLGKALAEFRKASANMRTAVETEMRELERHANEIETKALEETAVISAEESGAAGSNDPQPVARDQESLPPAVGSEDAPGEPSADGHSKPA
jgi:sec-independent protein translocase protein TatA